MSVQTLVQQKGKNSHHSLHSRYRRRHQGHDTKVCNFLPVAWFFSNLYFNYNVKLIHIKYLLTFSLEYLTSPNNNTKKWNAMGILGWLWLMTLLLRPCEPVDFSREDTEG